MDDAAGVQEVQALRHRQRHLLAPAVPVELMRPEAELPPQRSRQVSALRGGPPRSSMVRESTCVGYHLDDTRYANYW